MFKTLYTSSSDFHPGLPEGIIEASLPFDWIEGDTDERHIFELSRAERDEWQKRFRRLRTILHISGTEVNTLDFDFEADRQAVDENELRKPGIKKLREPSAHTEPPPDQCRFLGSDSISGFDGDPSNTASCDATIELFLKTWIQPPVDPFPVEHYPFHVKSGDIWIPYIRVRYRIVVDAGAEYALDIESTQSVTGFTGEFCPDHGGGTMNISVTSDAGPGLFIPDLVTLEIEPNLFYGWGGLWNTATGAPN